MARLETQINQIYLVNPEAKKTSLVLYEESLSTTSQLFVLAELSNLQKKSANLELKRLSEIILESFRINKKLSGETLFESALAQINQNLADLAHEGRKAWVGKFSCVIALKSHSTIYLANTGPASAHLQRGAEILEILPGEKRGDHPIKTFSNFTQGKLAENDLLILTATSIFNYVTLELLSKILNSFGPDEASVEISRIVQDALSTEQGFAAFLLGFDKNLPEPAIAVEPIYEPLPEEEIEEPAKASRLSLGSLSLSRFKPSLPASLSFRLPKMKLPNLRWQFFRNLSLPGKFLFVSFALFLILFIVNLSIYGIRLHGRNAETRLTTLTTRLTQEMADAQSALIYKNDSQALELYNAAAADFAELKKLNAGKAGELQSELETLRIVVNKISVVENPTLVTQPKHEPIFLTQDQNKFVFAASDSNSLSSFDTSLKDYFLLNSLPGPITALASFSPAGLTMSTADKIYYIDQGLKQFELLMPYDGGQIQSIKGVGPALWVMNKATGQINKITFSKNKYTSAVAATDDLADARDFGPDNKDLYVLYPNQVHKITGGKTQVFALPPMSDSITNADRIIVASNLYILEANKKRVIILNKNGVLLNQIYFPHAVSLRDFYVNEASRSLYLLDSNQLVKITF